MAGGADVPARPGRPCRAEAPGRLFHVRLSPRELDRVRRAAAVNRQGLSEFARDALVSAASDSLDDEP